MKRPAWRSAYVLAVVAVVILALITLWAINDRQNRQGAASSANSASINRLNQLSCVNLQNNIQQTIAARQSAAAFTAELVRLAIRGNDQAGVPRLLSAAANTDATRIASINSQIDLMRQRECPQKIPPKLPPGAAP